MLKNEFSLIERENAEKSRPSENERFLSVFSVLYAFEGGKPCHKCFYREDGAQVAPEDCSGDCC